MAAIWHKNGYVTIPVEQSHIGQSMQRNSALHDGVGDPSGDPGRQTHLRRSPNHPLHQKGFAIPFSDAAILPGQHHRFRSGSAGQAVRVEDAARDHRQERQEANSYAHEWRAAGHGPDGQQGAAPHKRVARSPLDGKSLSRSLDKWGRP